MRKHHLILLALLAFFAACQTNTSNQDASDTSLIDTVISSTATQYCYSYIKNRDTATLTLMSSGAITTGELKYKLYEKDSNAGIIKGELRGDTLIADYNFSSEGKESSRQVAFLKKGNQLLEGYGEVEEKDGKTVFKNTATLKFGEAIVFDKVDCN